MISYTITRRIEFDAGHRIYGHESKCANIHGHRYVALITCCPADHLDELGRVIDFSVIKERIGGWIDMNLDHGMILFKGDPLCELFSERLEDHKFFVMDTNPTAENIAELIYRVAKNTLPQSIKMCGVKLYETPNCYAVYSER